jgi:hypothetical protein
LQINFKQAAVHISGFICMQLDRCLTGGEQTLDKFGAFIDPHVWLRNDYNMTDVLPEVRSRGSIQHTSPSPQHTLGRLALALLVPVQSNH